MDFVTFEIAKKLKEKGFKEKCLTYYDVEDNVGLLYNTQYTDEVLPCQYTDLLQCHNTGEAEPQIDDSNFCIDAPTISQVLKWLRDEKNIYCLPWFEQGVDMWFYAICKPAYGCEFPEFMSKSDYDTYEQAALAGIENVLDNLI